MDVVKGNLLSPCTDPPSKRDPEKSIQFCQSHLFVNTLKLLKTSH